MAKKLSNDELLAIIAAYEKDAIGSSVAAGITVYPNNQNTMTTLQVDNYEAWNTYNALPMGNEQPDRSQIVVPVLRDVIEWIMPQLMRVFCSTDNICRFEPQGPQDEALAEQQTDVCNYIFMRENDGFNVLYDYIKEALLLRNGYMKADWVTKREVKIERYTGLDEDALTKITQDAEEDGDVIEFMGKDERTETRIIGVPGAPGQPPQSRAVKVPVWDVKLRRVSKRGRVVVCAVPREDVFVSPKAREGLDDAPYYCHKRTKTRSELIQDGFDRKTVEDAATGHPDWLNIDALARDRVVDELSFDTKTSDTSMQAVEVRDVCLRVDFDGDGIAELRRVVILGDQVAENEEIEEGDMAAGTAVRMPHRHVGISLYELLRDLQAIKTDLTRQALDNAYLINNTRVAVDQDNVNFDDLMTNRPGGIIRVRGVPGQSLMPVTTQNVLTELQGIMGYMDEQQQWRTGVGADTTIMNPDELTNVTKANGLALLSKSELKVEQMARLLSEGIRDIFRKINNLIIRHQDERMVLNLRGKWVEVDPSAWRTREAVSINVGLGSGNREEMRANLMLLGQMLQQAHAAGMVSPQNAYNFFRKSAETIGFNSPDEFLTDPMTPQGQQLQKSLQKPPLPLLVAQAKAQADAQSAQQAAQLEVMKTRAQQQAETAKNVFQARLQAAIGAEKNRLDTQAKLTQTAADMQSEREKAVLTLAAQLAEAALRANSQPQQITQDMRAAEGAVNG